METKICKNCSIEKEISNFYLRNNKTNAQCKDCIKIKVKERRDKNKEIDKEKNHTYFKEYRERNKEKIKEWKRLDYLNNKEKIKERSKIYYYSNKDEINKNNCRRNKNNRNKINKYKREYNLEKRKNNPLFKLTNNIRAGIYNSIIRKGYDKSNNTYSILCCTYDEFSKYIESKFENWMSWENYGKYNGELNYGWDLDHIIPVSSAKNEDDVIILNHYTNFQPLCSKINRDIKKDKLTYEN